MTSLLFYFFFLNVVKYFYGIFFEQISVPNFYKIFLSQTSNWHHTQLISFRPNQSRDKNNLQLQHFQVRIKIRVLNKDPTTVKPLVCQQFLVHL